MQIAVEVNDEDALRAAAFAIVNNAPGEEEFARLATQTVEAALSTLMVQSRDIEGAVQALASRISGMRLIGLGASDGDARPVDRLAQATIEREPQTREELTNRLYEGALQGMLGLGRCGRRSHVQMPLR